MTINLIDQAQREAEAFQAFSVKWQLQNPPPESASLGFKFFALVVISISAIVLAALRTAFQFYRAAQLDGEGIIALATAVSALLAIEGGLVVYAAIRAEREQNVSRSKIAIAIFLMLIISIMAGVGQSLNIVSGISPEQRHTFDITLALVMGIGASILAWISGDVLGGQLAIAKAKTSFDTEEYQKSMLASWNRSAERKIVRGELVNIDQMSYAPESVDWRNLSGADQRHVFDLTVDQIMREYNVSDRTARNWKNYSIREFG